MIVTTKDVRKVAQARVEEHLLGVVDEEGEPRFKLYHRSDDGCKDDLGIAFDVYHNHGMYKGTITVTPNGRVFAYNAGDDTVEIILYRTVTIETLRKAIEYVTLIN